MQNIIFVVSKNNTLNKGLSYEIDNDFEEYKTSIINILEQNKFQNIKLLTIIIDSEERKEQFKGYINEDVQKYGVEIEYISLSTKHISKSLNIEENYFNNLIRVLIQITKINLKDNINSKFIFINLFQGNKNYEYISIMSIISDLYAVEIFFISNQDNMLEKVVNYEGDYSQFKMYYQLLKSIYKYGYMIENIGDKKVINKLRYIIEENSGMYRLTPLGERIFEKINNYNYENSKIKFNRLKKVNISKYMENILESIRIKKYIDEVRIVSINEYVSEDYFNIDMDNLNNLITGNICDGRLSYSLNIKINTEYDIVDACIDLENRYCKVEKKENVPLTKFILIRHADDLGEYENRIAGCYDFDLTQKGKEQVELLSQRLKKEEIKADIIYTSPLKRAIKTAEEVAKIINSKVISYEPLSGVNYGYSSGLTKREALIKYPNPKEGYIPSSNIWGKESEIEYSCRVVNAFYNIYKSNIGKIVMIVTHGRAISAIIREIMELPASKEVWVKCDDTSIHEFLVGNNFVEIIRVNDTMHLKNI